MRPKMSRPQLSRALDEYLEKQGFQGRIVSIAHLKTLQQGMRPITKRAFWIKNSMMPIWLLLILNVSANLREPNH